MHSMRGWPGAWAGRAVAAVVFAAAAGTGGNGLAGDPLSITRLYGAGVHAYFSGDYPRSYDDLTASIEAGSKDPRTRYFRGLAALGLGRLDEAEADFSAGAVLESETGGNWPVSRSLERVQGQQRIQLERHRARARVAAMQRAHDREVARYVETESARPDVERGRRPAGTPPGPGERSNPFAPETGTGSTPDKRAEEPEQMPEPVEPAEPAEPGPTDRPAEEEPSTGETDLQPEMEQPVELPGEGGATPETPPAEKPLDSGEAADPAEPPAEGEDSFGDKAS